MFKSPTLNFSKFFYFKIMSFTAASMFIFGISQAATDSKPATTNVQALQVAQCMYPGSPTQNAVNFNVEMDARDDNQIHNNMDSRGIVGHGRVIFRPGSPAQDVLPVLLTLVYTKNSWMITGEDELSKALLVSFVADKDFRALDTFESGVFEKYLQIKGKASHRVSCDLNVENLKTLFTIKQQPKAQIQAIPKIPNLVSTQTSQAAAEINKNINIVVFYASWCGYCRRLERDLKDHNSYESIQINGQTIAVEWVDVEHKKPGQTALEGSGIPYIIIRKGSEKISSQRGYGDYSSFLNFLKQNIK